MLGHPASAPSADFTIPQDWAGYSETEHRRWRELFRRQAAQLPGRAVQQFLDGLDILEVEAGGIPDFERLNRILAARTGWTIVAVPGLVPDDVFFAHLADRRFPATRFIRPAESLDYVQEPDIFHDVFGHVPLLAHPVFADFMAAYGRQGLAAAHPRALQRLARLYWYTVEFGLIATPDGLRIYGAGIVSSFAEVLYCLDDHRPRRAAFDLIQVMRRRYRIDAFQQTYFVIDDFSTLFAALDRDLGPAFARAGILPELAPGQPCPGEKLIVPGGSP